jgi:hypothetical protein
MKKSRLLPLVAFVVGLPAGVFATPSTELWTAGTTDIQAFGIGHLDIDDYFHPANSSSEAQNVGSASEVSAFPTDVGYTVGILPFSKVNMEIGLDFMGAGSFPLLGNTKLALIEDAFFKGQPAIAVGLFDVGVKTDATDLDIRYLNIGKTIPIIGRLFVGGYEGNKTIRGFNADGTVAGDNADQGITLAWDRSFLPAKSASGTDYTRLTVCADVATGDNAYGGGGPGVSWNFNENICVLAGPIFYNDRNINGKWKITTQLDVNFKTW